MNYGTHCEVLNWGHRVLNKGYLDMVWNPCPRLFEKFDFHFKLWLVTTALVLWKCTRKKNTSGSCAPIARVHTFRQSGANGLMLMVYNRLQKKLSACLFAIRLYNSVLDYIVLVFALSFCCWAAAVCCLILSLLALVVFSLFPVSSCWHGVYQTMFASLLIHW
jgi:hypothetical protein